VGKGAGHRGEVRRRVPAELMAKFKGGHRKQAGRMLPARQGYGARSRAERRVLRARILMR
jgi:hypothetical protein